MPSDTTTAPTPPERVRAWLRRLFNGTVALSPYPHASLPTAICSPSEYEAISQALGCPDLFAMVGEKASRERVIVEIARESAHRGERVLILSPDSMAVDRIALSLAGAKASVIRALDRDEDFNRLPTNIARLTSTVIGTGRIERVRRDANSHVAQLQTKLDELARAATSAQELVVIADRENELEVQQGALTESLKNLETRVRAECESLSGPFEKYRTEVDEIVKYRTEREELSSSIADKNAHLVTRSSAMNSEPSKKQGLFARLLGIGRSSAGNDTALLDMPSLDSAREIGDSTERLNELDSLLKTAEARLTSDREAQFAIEIGLHRTALESEIDALSRQRAQFAQQASDLVPSLQRVGINISLEERSAIREIYAKVASIVIDAEAQLTSARTRLADFEENAPEGARKFLAEASIVVGTPRSLDVDPVFVSASTPTAFPFSLLILDHAQELTETDFLALSAEAGKWILAADDQPIRGFLAQVSRALDREQWVIEGNRLVYRLSHPAPERRKGMTYEPLLDRPEIELRFLSVGSSDPVLVEIAFPATTSIAHAKEFVARELDSISLRPCGQATRDCSAERLCIHWPAVGPESNGIWIDLAYGVRECVRGEGAAGFTAAIAFDFAAGWDEEKAELWLKEHSQAHSRRFAYLPSRLPADNEINVSGRP